MAIRYVHTNLVARDWRALAAFYCDVFACVPVGPERDLAGPAVAAGIGVAGASLAGVHLRLPGHGDHGPTLEIYRYEPQPAAPAPSVLRPGFGHLAFAVDDVVAMRARVLRAGGSAVGEVVTTSAGPRSIEWCYVTDPEGNVLELQRG
ncbi:MAG: VOC family protein [Deltaproteobacteria bacterium]|nr:VOC family protein [Deltaproteobacteria bacterium]